MSRVLFFDVETPNRYNDRICGLGVIVEEDGEVVFQKGYLVNPEVSFDEMNINIHGICPGDVKDKLTFPKVWEEVSDYFKTSILVGHNLIFDLAVLEKTLNSYGLIAEEWVAYYEDTYYKAKSCYSIPGYRLNDVCDFLGIVLDKHHDAMCDTSAAKDIYNIIKNSVGWENYDVRTKLFSPNAKQKNTVIPIQKFSDETIAIRALKDILKEISDDSIVSESEMYSLSIWIEQLGDLKERYPFSKIVLLIAKVLEDGRISEEENQELLVCFETITCPVHNGDTLNDSEEEIILDGKTCCLTGNFTSGSKTDIQRQLESKGSKVVNSVTKKLDYLIVGGEGSTAWAYGNYGSKVKKALEYIDNGVQIRIVGEREIVF